MKTSKTDRGQKALLSLERRLRVSNRSEQTIRNYVRCVKALMDYHQQLPDELEIDHIIDFLNELQMEQERAWRTIKIYVAAFRWFYEHILQAKEFAMLIPYPKEKPSLPQVLSREELARLFNCCSNKKHRAMFRLLYSSGLRRNELLHLKIEDIITTDGRNRIRINKGKGGKDRYTVLSGLVLAELREYFKVYRPVTYLFNGRQAGQRMSPAGLRHAMAEAAKKAGISRSINLHILRHCGVYPDVFRGLPCPGGGHEHQDPSIPDGAQQCPYHHGVPARERGAAGEGLQPAGQMGKAIVATMADVMQRFSAAYIKNHPTNPQQLRLIHDILACRTRKLGSHTSACTGCGDVKVHYNSCGNRGCPNCQGTNKEKWVLERTGDLLPVKHFHMVFTLPAQLRRICGQNRKLAYNLLFQCAWQTLDTFSKDPAQKLEATMGMVAVLHTWTQQLHYHPHVHCIVPAGGIAPDGKWKHTKSSGKFLFHVKALAKTFRGKFMEQLVSHYKAGNLSLEGKLAHLQDKEQFWQFKKRLYEKEWVVYAKEAFGNPASVVEYLGRYTHKIAISNHRILAVDEKTVTFSYLDRKGNCKKTCTLPGEKFIARFLLHVLPKGYTRIRHYGFFATRVKTKVLPPIRKKLGLSNVPKKKYTVRDVLMITRGIDPLLCSTCGGLLLTIAETPRPRGSPQQRPVG